MCFASSEHAFLVLKIVVCGQNFLLGLRTGPSDERDPTLDAPVASDSLGGLLRPAGPEAWVRQIVLKCNEMKTVSVRPTEARARGRGPATLGGHGCALFVVVPCAAINGCLYKHGGGTLGACFKTHPVALKSYLLLSACGPTLP